jgi:hypothetical protein
MIEGKASFPTKLCIVGVASALGLLSTFSLASFTSSSTDSHSVTLQARQADTLADFIGVNTHLHYSGSVYDTGWDSIIKPKLLELGLRHIRDGHPTNNQKFDQRILDLAANGIRYSAIIDYRYGHSKSVEDHAQHIRYLNSFPSRPVEQVEGPNEVDKSASSGWPREELRDWIREMRVVFGSTLPTLPLLGPSFANTLRAPPYFAEVAQDAAQNIDICNLHNYSGHNPIESPRGGGWGLSYDQAVNAYRQNLCPDKPFITTEYGLKLSGSKAGFKAVSERAAAKYLLRSILFSQNKGAERIYLYQLIDYNREDFGLLNRDGSTRKSFEAIKNLITLMKDPGPPFEPDQLTFEITGDIKDLHYAAYQRRDKKSFYLVLWLGVESFAERNLETERKLNITVPGGHDGIRVYDPSFRDTVPLEVHPAGNAFSVNVHDYIIITEIMRPSAGKRENAEQDLSASPAPHNSKP